MIQSEPATHDRSNGRTPSPAPSPAVLTPCQAAALNLTEWCEQAEAVAVQLHKLTGPVPHEFLECIYGSYVFTRQKDDIRNKIIDISRLRDQIYECQNHVLQLAGVGIQWRRVEDILKAVVRVVRWLEDVLCWAMIDITELISMHNHGQLEYQLG